MPPRKSDRIHALRGTARRDRHPKRDVALDGEGVGAPPEEWHHEAKGLWLELTSAARWLTPADRLAVELAVRSMDALRGGEATAAMFAQVGRCLDRLGLSPQSRGEATAIPPAAPPDELEAALKLDRVLELRKKSR